MGVAWPCAQLDQWISPVRAGVGPPAEQVHLDSTIVRYIRTAAGRPCKVGQALGRSRGGLTTKLHAIVHDDRLPLVMALTPGQFGDATWGRHLLEQLGPQTGWPQLVADRAGYRAKSLAERFRGLATRYHKLDVVYLHMVYLARIDVAML